MENFKKENVKKKTSTGIDVVLAAEALNIKLRNQNSSFFEIGEDMVAVREKCSVKEFRQYLKLINLERTNASRYMECAKSDRLKEYREPLSHIICWTTLDKIRILSEEDFEFFKSKYLSGNDPVKIRGKDVEACNSSVRNRPTAQVFKMQPITIAPKQDGFSQEVLDQFIEQMGQMRKLPGVSLLLPDNLKMEINAIAKTSDDVSESTVYDPCSGLLSANDNDDWQEHWKGMPSYESNKKDIYKQLKVSFRNEEDYKDFQKRIGQPLTEKTKSIWHPKLVQANYKERMYA